MNEEKYFLKVNMLLVRKFGSDIAVLYSFLKFAARCRKKDKDDYCAIETEYISKNLGWSKTKVISVRGKMIKINLLRFKQGVNQNVKNKYKIL